MFNLWEVHMLRCHEACGVGGQTANAVPVPKPLGANTFAVNCDARNVFVALFGIEEKSMIYSCCATPARSRPAAYWRPVLRPAGRKASL